MTDSRSRLISQNISIAGTLLWTFLIELTTARLDYVHRLRKMAGSRSRPDRKRVKVALLIDEYFGGWDTPYGGYGFLARRIVARYLPNDDLDLEVILHGTKCKGLIQTRVIDGINVYRMSQSDRLTRLWLRIKAYDVFLSIELTSIDAIVHAPAKHKHLLWVQDPRPQSEWDEIATVKLFPEPSYYDQRIYDYVARRQNDIRFVTQGKFLIPMARELYQLSETVPIAYLPNPIEIAPFSDDAGDQKENLVIFLGRLDSVKRGWLFCEIAKRLPNLKFAVLGAVHRSAERNLEVLSPYIDTDGNSLISNLHFAGHLDGEAKLSYLRRAKVLVNTSIHEALPVSFLEALASGTLLVSCRNPEGLTEQFGRFVGTVLGDGFESIDTFTEAINLIIEDDEWRRATALAAHRYLVKHHTIEQFQQQMRAHIIDMVRAP